MIDLRSDTVTVPTPAMLSAMMSAPVGDDVYGEDPTVNALEERLAAMFGLQAGLFVPTGTMANQIAIRIHCQPQDEVLLESTSHIYIWEAGGPAVLSGVTCRPVDGHNGLLGDGDLANKIRPKDMHNVRTRLVCLENTHNRGGGTIYSPDAINSISRWARHHGLAMHLDGARLWNAIAKTGIPAAKWADMFDTVSVCFSKGLGAPVGSMLLGPKDLIQKARQIRKLFGGAMRQVGYLAAACDYAVTHNLDRLNDDHAHAQLLAAAVENVPGFRLTPHRVETNLVWFHVDARHGSAQQVVAKLKEQGIRVSALDGETVRMCTHLNVSKADCERAALAISRL